MDTIFGALIWLIIIFIWIFSASKKTRRKDSESREKTPPEFEKKILEALGMSFPEIPEPDIQKPLEIQEEIHYAEKEKETQTPPEIPKPVVAKVIVEETEREFPDSSTVEKLQEGVVFSVILGPPKAYQFLGLYSNPKRIDLPKPLKEGSNPKG